MRLPLGDSYLIQAWPSDRNDDLAPLASALVEYPELAAHTTVRLRAMSPEQWGALTDFPAGVELALDTERLPPYAVGQLERLGALRGLRLKLGNSGEERVSAADLMRLAALPNLRGLELRTLKDVPDGAVQAIAASLSLEEFAQGLDGDDTMTDAQLRMLAGLKHLRTLRVHGGKLITDQGVSALASCLTLETLTLYNTQIDDAGVRLLAGLPRLAWLDISRTGVTDAGLAALAKVSTLRHLSVGMCKGVTDAGLAALAECTSLRSLSLFQTRITNAGLDALTKLPELASLNLYMCEAIDDGAVATLSKLAGLRSLGFQNTGITAAGSGTLAKNLPNCDQGG